MSDDNDRLTSRQEEESSIFTKKGEVFESLAEAMDIRTSPVRLAELMNHLHSTIRSTVAQNPCTPFFVLFQALGDDDYNVRSQATYTLSRLHKEYKIDLSDKGLWDVIMKYEKDNLKAIEAFEDLKSKVRPRKDD